MPCTAFTEQGVARPHRHRERRIASPAPTTARSRSPGAQAGAEQSDVFDAVVMATGWPADVEDLGLEAAGVADRARSAIPVDQYFRIERVAHLRGRRRERPRHARAGRARSRARRRPRTRCSTPTAARRTTCCRPAASPIPTTPASGSPRSRRAPATRTASSRRARYADLERAVIDDRTARLPEAHRRPPPRTPPRRARGRGERDRGHPVRDDGDGGRHRSGDAGAA